MRMTAFQVVNKQCKHNVPAPVTLST